MIKKNLNFLFIILIFSISFSSNFYYGSIGVFPIDTFAFFDSANFINKGFLPIRDYWTSNGFLVDILQSFFFKFFGVNWYSYLLHSSLLNFLFAFFTYKFLKFLGLNSNYSLFYSVSSALLAYPVVGVPFPDHHSIFLSFISIYFLIYAINKNEDIYWLLIPFILFLAFLSKQVPAAFFILMVVVYSIITSFLTKNFKKFKPILISSFFSLVLLITFLLLNKIEIKNFLIQYIYFPITIGNERGLELREFLSIFLKDFKFFTLIFLIYFFLFIRRSKFKEKIFNNFFKIEFIILLSSFVAIYNQTLMKNQNIIFFILPILIGVIHANIQKITNLNKIYLILIIIINIFVTSKYHLRFNHDRKFIELENIEKSNAVDAFELSNNLVGLKWVTNKSEIYKVSEIKLLKDSIAYLRNNASGKLIITDYQFVLSEINHNYYPPNRWFTTDGTSYPLMDNKYFDFYKKFFKQKIVDYKIDTVFTLGSIDQKAFDFIVKKNCVEINKVNDVLFEYKLLNCVKK